MSYSYVRAIAKPKGRMGRWQNVDLSTMPLYQIYETYAAVYLVLTNPYEEGEVALDLDAVRDSVSLDSRTIRLWLNSLGNKSLPTTDTIPQIVVRTTRYRDAWLANYDVKLVPRLANADADLPNSEKDDVLLTRAGTDYNTFYKHCLVSVNGLFHQTRYSVNGVYVTNAGKSGRIANRNNIGILSFLDVGELKFVPITTDMIYRPFEGNKLGNAAYINLKQSTENKTVLLVLGGYLHVLDQNYQIVGDGLIKIDFNNLPLTQRFFESKHLIDLSSLPLTQSKVNPDLVSLEELYSDAVIERYLTLSQSFFVVVDAPELFVERYQLERTSLPGRYISHQEPRYHLELDLGRVGDYWVKTEDGQYVVAVDSNQVHRYQYETTGWQEAHAIDPSREPSHPWDYSRGFFVEIGRDLQL